MTVTFTCSSEAQTMQLGARLGRLLRGGEIVTLEGPLGAGKTCFVRGLAQGLGIDPNQVSSPTFVISQEYSDGSSLTLVHIDAYRLSAMDDLESIGWDELLSPEHVIAVEWPQRIADALAGLDVIAVALAHKSPQSRAITITSPAELAQQMEVAGG